MQKKLVLILVLLIMISNTGCWDLREAEETGIVVGGGFDRGKDGSFIVIAQTVNPQPPGAGGGGSGGGGMAQETFHNWYGIGETVFDATRNLTMKSPNALFWSHNKIYIFSEKLAREGLSEYMDFIERDPEFKQSAWVLIARDNLLDVLQASGNLRQPPAQILADIIEIRDRNSKYAISNLSDFIKQLGSPETQAYTAGVTFYQGLMEEKNKVSLPSEEAPRAKELRIMDTAIFNGDKLVGWFNNIESRGLLWIQGEVNQGLLVLKMENQRITFEIFQSSSKLEPTVQDGQLIMKINVKVSGNIGELTPGSKLEEKFIKTIESQIAITVKKQILAAVTKAQELNSDVLGFGPAVHRAFPKVWDNELSKQWPEIFKDLDVEIAVEANVRGTGLTSNPVAIHKQ
ncbi:Ger(x)C family spore germination protein [Desulfotomaculum defluvii]